MSFELMDLADFSKKKFDELAILDVRPSDQFEQFHIPEGENLPLDRLLYGDFANLSKDKHYHVICRTTNKAYQASNILDEAGYQVTMVLGGMSEYQGPVMGSLGGKNPYLTDKE